MLKNALTLASGGVDTAENGPSKVRQVSNEIRHNIGDGPLARELRRLTGAARTDRARASAAPRGRVPKVSR